MMGAFSKPLRCFHSSRGPWDYRFRPGSDHPDASSTGSPHICVCVCVCVWVVSCLLNWGSLFSLFKKTHFSPLLLSTPPLLLIFSSLRKRGIKSSHPRRCKTFATQPNYLFAVILTAVKAVLRHFV